MTSILVVSSFPDDRPSTRRLRDLVELLEQRPDVRVETWFLRAYRHHQPWRGSFVVDHLRTRGLSGALRRARVPFLPDLVAGRLLRWRLRRLAPDVVVLDDGLGHRVLGGLPGSVPIVSRLNAVPPLDLHDEVTYDGATWVVVEPAVDTDRLENVQRTSAFLDDYSAVVALAAPVEVARRRRGHRVPEGAPLVTGWGEDGWLDAPDVFIRLLWALEWHQGVVAHGLWIAEVSPDERFRLEAEARRCGVADRYVLARGDEGDRYCGDAVFLPWRTPGDPSDLVAATIAGLHVTAFPLVALADDAIEAVDYLDVETAAASVARALTADRSALADEARERHDLGRFAARLVGLGRDVGA